MDEINLKFGWARLIQKKDKDIANFLSILSWILQMLMKGGKILLNSNLNILALPTFGSSQDSHLTLLLRIHNH